MKNSIKVYLIAILLSFPFLIMAQSVEDEINTIRKWYGKVEGKLTNCQVVELSDWVDDEDYSGYMPEITGYYDKDLDQFIKIVEIGYADWHEITKMYYLNNGELFFIFMKGYYAGEMYTAEELGISEEEFWQMGGEAKNLDAFEERIYFSNEKIIRYLIKEKTFPVNEANFNMSDIDNEKGNIEKLDSQRMSKHVQKMLAALNEIR